ncbi:MAG: histidine kinase dimerization/phospho-acceptor domain-containing protein [Gemmatimonadota bacterium]
MTSSFAMIDTAESSRILASALEQAAESIVVTRAAMGKAGPEVLFVNAAFCRLTLYAPSEVVGQDLDLLQGPRSNRGILEQLRERVSRGLPFTSESIAYRKDGTQFLAEWDLAPVFDEQGRVTQFVAILRDVTGLRRVQAELLEAKALAEAADHGKSAFLATMSHELRTPLNAIIGFSELLDERAPGPLNERQGKYVTNVLTAGRSLLDLIDQILDLTRADVGQMTLHLTKFSLEDAVHDVQPLVQALAERKHLRLRIEVPDSLPLIRADARKLKQIIYSLLTSAIRTASTAGDLEVSARHYVSGSSGSEWFDMIVSRSTGDAKDDAMAREEFDVDEAPGISSPDAGLGLALTRRLVELHGGRVVLDARPGGGLAFRLTLPGDPNPGIRGSVSAWLVKPVDRNELIGVGRDVIKERKE